MKGWGYVLGKIGRRRRVFFARREYENEVLQACGAGLGLAGHIDRLRRRFFGVGRGIYMGLSRVLRQEVTLFDRNVL